MATTQTVVPEASDDHWLFRFVRYLINRYRPFLGWLVLLVFVLLAMLPGQALDIHNWIRVRRLQNALVVAGPLAVLTGWLLLGWRRPRPALTRWWRLLLLFLLGEGVGLVVLSQLFVRWWPTIGDLFRAANQRAWPTVAADMGNQLAALGTRLLLWWQGVQAGGAAQDDLVFAGIAGLLLWTGVLVSVYLAFRMRRGLVAAFPLLWMTILPLIYSRGGRPHIVAGLALALLLHLILDQRQLRERWRAHGWDSSDDLFLDRILTVLGTMAVVLTLASVTPSIVVRPVSDWYFNLISPVDDRLDEVSDRLFPEIKGSRRFAGMGVGGGLPNEFLLRAGPDLGQAVVMQVRTSDMAFEGPLDVAPEPPGHYMRGATYNIYTGRGWDNTRMNARVEYAANDRWVDLAWSGRRPVVQSVNLTFASAILYAAPEPVEPSLDYRVEVRGDGADMVALYSRAESYSVTSLVPAVSAAQLAAVPPFAPGALPIDAAVHLDLPETITPRTEELAAQLAAGLDSPYAIAGAIETYLRGYEYDLTVPAPPPDVADVADYFLFDLGRGYCDYYATAFVVLARLNGLPARFATGFAVGAWDGYNRIWTITEAEAHSWPEVYFPDYGWIPFEPTAGRPELVRIGLPEASASSAADLSAPIAEPITAPGIDWNWQMLLWLLPLGLVIWGGWVLTGRWRAARQDPWQSMLRWGERAGRPMDAGETTREYGRQLAEFITAHHQGEPGTGRYAAGEVDLLSRDVTVARYGPRAAREQAIARATARWQTLRSYLRRLRLR